MEVVTKYTYIIFIIFSASLYSQEDVYSYHSDSTTLDRALVEVATLAGLEIGFHEAYFSDDTHSYTFTSASLDHMLGAMLDGTEINYELTKKRIHLIRHKSVLGRVLDKENSIPLANATIFNATSNRGTYTDSQGYYAIEVPFESTELEVSFIGYESKKISLSLSDKINAEVFLNSSLTLDEVVVKSNTIFSPTNRDNIVELPTHLKPSLSVGGEPDVLQRIKQEPGVISGPDGFGGINIRGSSGGPKPHFI